MDRAARWFAGLVAAAVWVVFTGFLLLLFVLIPLFAIWFLWTELR